MITIFTPTYNREHYLKRLYMSLTIQTDKDFEWLIVDDGSIDATENLIQSFIENEKSFSIRYYKTVNGGKHRAINKGVQLAKGEWFFIVDSDDWLTEKAVQIIKKYCVEILDNEQFVGVAGLKVFENNKIVGSTFKGKCLDATSLERKRFNILGDKAEIFKTGILKKYPFPEYKNEKFMSEAVVWNKIAYDGYKIRWFNEDIYFCEYQEEGLTNNLRNNYRNSPNGYLHYVEQEIRFNKETLLRRYILYGKCIRTIDIRSFKKENILKKLKINNMQYCFGKIVYGVYSIVRKVLKRK